MPECKHHTRTYHGCASQVVVGLLVVFLLLMNIQGKFGAIAVFREIYERIPQDWDQFAYYSFLSARGYEMTCNTTECRKILEEGNAFMRRHQSDTCHIWSQCIEGSPSLTLSGFSGCGQCRVQRPLSVSEEELRRPTFSDGNLFAGKSLVTITAFASSGGAVGLIVGLLIMRKLAKTGWATSLCATLIIAVLFAIAAVTVSSFSSALPKFDPLRAHGNMCSDTDIDPDRAGGQIVSRLCLGFAAGVDKSDTFVVDAALSVTGALVNMLLFLFESLSNLANAIRERGANQWAKFEAKIFFGYFIFILASIAVLSALYEKGDLQNLYDVWRSNSLFAGEVMEGFGPTFPLTLDDRWAFERQHHLATTNWCARPLSPTH
jgi:hypothetical protein